MTVIDGVISIKKWYFFEDEVKKYSRNENYETVKSNYIKLLTDSIKLRFRADVKVGFNVSGGVDSSTLLAFVNMMYGEDNIEAYKWLLLAEEGATNTTFKTRIKRYKAHLKTQLKTNDIEEAKKRVETWKNLREPAQ